MSILFLRTAKELEDKFSINTYLIDFEDGFMARNLNEKNKLISFEASKDLMLDQDKTNSSVIVLQSMTPWTIYKNIKLDNAKVVFGPVIQIILFQIYLSLIDLAINLRSFS